MIWFLLYLFASWIVLSFPMVWVVSKLDKSLAYLISHDPDYRFIIALGWPVFLCAALIFQLRYIWDPIYLKMFQGEK